MYTRTNLMSTFSNRFTSTGGGGTLIFSYVRGLGPFVGVQNFEFQ